MVAHAPYILSSQQVSDVPTNGLLKQNFDFCVSKLGLIISTSQLEENC